MYKSFVTGAIAAGAIAIGALAYQHDAKQEALYQQKLLRMRTAPAMVVKFDGCSDPDTLTSNQGFPDREGVLAKVFGIKSDYDVTRDAVRKSVWERNENRWTVAWSTSEYPISLSHRWNAICGSAEVPDVRK